MDLRSRLALLCYGAAGLASLVLGVVYVVRSEFMPYHAEAVGSDWAMVPEGTRALITALMNVVGAAWIIVGCLILALVSIPFRSRVNWARWTLPVMIVIHYGSILAVTLQVQAATGAHTPWLMNAFAVAVGITGLLLDRPWTSRAQNSPS